MAQFFPLLLFLIVCIVSSAALAQSSRFWSGGFITEGDEAWYSSRGRTLLAPAPREYPSLANQTQPLASLTISEGLTSSVTCSHARIGITPEPIVCVYSNLLVWSGNFYFVGKEPTLNAWALTQIHKNKTSVMSTFAALGATPETLAAKVKLAALITPQQYSNYHSLFGLTLPTVYGVLCKQFDKCTYDAASLPQLLLANPETVKEADSIKPIRHDWTSCSSATPVIQHNASSLASKLLLLETAVMLFSPTCNTEGAPECAPWQYTIPPSSQIVYAPWRNYLGSCLGFDAASHGPKGQVNILIVDRDYWLGRHILNIHEMQRQVKEKYATANVTVFYPERWSLTEQAAVYSNSHVIIWVTGASMTNMLFAPHGSFGLHLGLKELPTKPYDQTSAWVLETVPHNVELHHVRTRNPDRIILRTYMVYKNPQYDNLTDDEKLSIWEVKTCPGNPGDLVNTLCEDVWIAKGGEYEMEFGFLWEGLDNFMPRVLEAAGIA